MELQTRRLILRPWADADAADLYQYAQDPRVGPIAGWPPHTGIADSLNIIHTVLAAPETYAVVLRESGKPVGSCGILFAGSGSAPIGESEAEIGYWLGVPFWGRGLIPEAVERLLARCFLELDCSAVWCGYYDGNEKSRRVMEKCGFLYHHFTPDLPTLLGDRRTEHFTCQTKAQWQTHIASL